jgi:hypothetical protein
VAVATVGAWGWRIASRVQNLITRLDELEAAAGDLDVRRWAEICPRLALTTTAAEDLRQTAGPALPLTIPLASLTANGDLVASKTLLDIAASLGTAGAGACATLTALAAPPESGVTVAEAAVARLAAARPRLIAAREELDRTNALLGQIHTETLSPRVGTRVAQLTKLLPLARNGIDLALALPELLGANGQHSYLIIAQNPDELRPTGGFMSAAGLLMIKAGRVVSLDLADSTLVDNLAGGHYPLAPEPMRRYMVAPAMAPGLWVFRDANWSPDFPTAARAMLDLYRRGKGTTPDGVIAFTPETIRLLLAALGPVAVEASSEPVSAQNLTSYIRTVWSEASTQGRGAERKESLNRLAEALQKRLQERPDLNLTTLGRALQLALAQRELALYLPGSPAADLLARQGWDGGLRVGEGDFLLVASANVGYNKVGPNIEQRLSYAVDLSDPTAPQGSLTVSHRNNSVGAAGCRPLESTGRRYEDLMTGCYWSYVRVYVPGTATMTTYSVPTVPDSWMLNGNGDHGRVYTEPGEAATQVFGALIVVPRQSVHELTFRYNLAPSAVSHEGNLWHYRLTIQRQPGLRQRADVQVLLPPGAVLVASSPPALPKGGQIFTFALSLATDESLELTFQKP